MRTARDGEVEELTGNLEQPPAGSLSCPAEAALGAAPVATPEPTRMDLQWIQSLIQIMEGGDVTELELDDEQQGLRIRLRRGAPQPLATHGPMLGILPAGGVAAGAAPLPTTSPAAPAAAATRRSGTIEIKSPMVGTFYRAASPEAEPFVQVGARIGPESVICIVEAMKVMNEIKAEMNGEILEILVENGEPVEYGQPLFLVQAG